MSELEEEFEKRRQALEALEGDGTLFRDSRGQSEQNEELYGEDDLDVADRIYGSIPDGADAGLARKTSLRDKKWQGLVETAPFARTNPPSVLNGTIGGQQLATSPVVTGAQVSVEDLGSARAIQVANWGGDDAETMPITVTFSAIQDRRNFQTQPFGLRPIGLVRFGTRGMMVTALVDINTGTQFVVSGSSAVLQVLLAPDASAPVGSFTTMQLVGMLSFHPVIRTAPVTFTNYIDSIAGIVGPAFYISENPPFSKNVTFVTPDAVTVRLDFFDTNQVMQYTVVVVGGTIPAPIPIANDIFGIVVTPTVGTLHHGRMIYQLSF